MSCRNWFETMHCDDCGDRIIHQTLRGPTEASSGFNQFVHDEVAHLMFLADIDAMFYAKRNRLCRVCEHKHVGEPLKDSQREMLPLLDCGVELLKESKLVHSASGVYVIESDPPYTSAIIRPVLPQRALTLGPEIRLGSADFKNFLTCNIQDWEL